MPDSTTDLPLRGITPGRLLEVVIRNPVHRYHVMRDPSVQSPESADDWDKFLLDTQSAWQEMLKAVSPISAQGLARSLLFCEDPAKYSELMKASASGRFKVADNAARVFLEEAQAEILDPSGARIGSASRLAAERQQRVSLVSLRVASALRIDPIEWEYALDVRLRLPDPDRDPLLKVCASHEEFGDVQRLTASYIAGASPLERVLLLHASKREVAMIVQDKTSKIALGCARWWGISPGGVARMMGSKIRTGAHIDDDDRSQLNLILDTAGHRLEISPYAGIYLAMLVGETAFARSAVLWHAKSVIDIARRNGHPVFTRPNTNDGFRTARRFGLVQVGPESKLWHLPSSV